MAKAKPDWDSYCRKYYSFRLSINQGRVVAAVANEALGTFPKKIPPRLLRSLGKDVKTVALALKAAMEENAGNPSSTFPQPIKLESQNPRHAGLVLATLTLWHASMLLGRPSALKFDQFVLHQQLVMLIAHLDAFMSDSLRMICQVRPEVLKSKKTIESEQLLSLKDVDAIREFLTEKVVEDFSWLGLSKRLQFLEGLGLDVKVTEGALYDIEDAALVRNCVVHNGGRMTREYITKAKLRGVLPGRFISMTPDYVQEISVLVEALATELFRAVSVKFFGKLRGEVESVWVALNFQKLRARKQAKSRSGKVH